MTSTLDENTMELSQTRILNILTGILRFLHNVETDFTTNVLLLSQESLLHFASQEDFVMEYIKNTVKFCL